MRAHFFAWASLFIVSCSSSITPGGDSGGIDSGRADSGATIDSGGGAIDAGPSEGVCSTLAMCCPRITNNPEFHESCVLATTGGNPNACMASLAQDCCAALQGCCDMISA